MGDASGSSPMDARRMHPVALPERVSHLVLRCFVKTREKENEAGAKPSPCGRDSRIPSSICIVWVPGSAVWPLDHSGAPAGGPIELSALWTLPLPKSSWPWPPPYRTGEDADSAVTRESARK